MGVYSTCEQCGHNHDGHCDTARLERIREALMETQQFDNFECDWGFHLGQCPNIDCLHCTVFREVNPNYQYASLTGPDAL